MTTPEGGAPNDPLDDGEPPKGGAAILAFPPDGDRPKKRRRSRSGDKGDGAADDAEADDGNGDGPNALNRDHAFVLVGKGAVIIREQPDAPPEDRVRILSLEAFRAYYANRTYRAVSIDPLTKEERVTWPKIAPAWLQSKKRRTYDGVCFWPSRPNEPEGGARPPSNYFNLWRGFMAKPDESLPSRSAPAQPLAGTPRADRYSIFRDHLFTNICNGDYSLFTWVFGWFAHILQRPRERIGTALVLRGKMGVGKTVAGDVVGSLIASHYFLVDDPRYLVGNFNAHMATCLLLQVDEGFWAGDKAAEGRLKGLVTAPKQMIENKGVDSIRLDNFVRLLFSSNEGWVVPAGMDERRFAVIDVGDAAKENHGYFAELYRELANGGREALLADLLAFDLDGPDAPNLRAIPKTAALLEQKIRSLDPVPAWWHGRLVDGTQTHRAANWRPRIPVRTVYNDFLRTAEKAGVRRKANEIEFGLALARLVPAIRTSRAVEDVDEQDERGHAITVRKRVRCYDFPTLPEARDAFEAAMRQPLEWDADPPDDGGDDGARERDGSAENHDPDAGWERLP